MKNVVVCILVIAFGAVFGQIGQSEAAAAGDPGREQSDVLGVMYLETMVVSSGLTYFLKNIFQRTRPFVTPRCRGVAV